MADSHPCAHPGCSCMVEKGGPFGKVLQRALQGVRRQDRAALRMPAPRLPVRPAQDEARDSNSCQRA
mgnify:CR=1 FL=1